MDQEPWPENAAVVQEEGPPLEASQLLEVKNAATGNDDLEDVKENIVPDDAAPEYEVRLPFE